MTNQTIARHLEEDARLGILTELYRQNDGHLNDMLCVHALEAWGHFRSRDWTRTQLRKMEEVGAVRISEALSTFPHFVRDLEAADAAPKVERLSSFKRLPKRR